MKTVYICSALRGDYENNIKKAQGYCKEAFDQGVCPICPHIYFPSFVDDTVEEDRKRCMLLGISALIRCDEVWCYGEPTEGMKEELEAAMTIGIPVISK